MGRTIPRLAGKGSVSLSGLKRSRTRTLSSLIELKQHHSTPLFATKQERWLYVSKSKAEATQSSRPRQKGLSVCVCVRTHPMYSSSKGTNEDRPLDAATARTGPALAAATTVPDATRIIVLVLRSPRSLRALFFCLAALSLASVALQREGGQLTGDENDSTPGFHKLIWCATCPDPDLTADH